MPYYKRVVDGKVVEKACGAVSPGADWELIEGDPGLVEVIDDTVHYNSTRFLQSLANDPVFENLDEESWFPALGFYLMAGNFNGLVPWINKKMLAGKISQEQVTAFATKLATEEGVILGG